MSEFLISHLYIFLYFRRCEPKHKIKIEWSGTASIMLNVAHNTLDLTVFGILLQLAR